MRQHKIKISAIMWGSYIPTFLAAARQSPYIELSIFSQKEIENNIDFLEYFWKSAADADAIFFYWTEDGFWEEISARIGEFTDAKTIVTTSFDPANWGRNATVDQSVCAGAYAYLSEGGQENYQRLLEYIAHQVNPEIEIREPVPLPWQGILDPPDQTVYDSSESYRKKYPANHPNTVGLLFSRHTFTNTDGSLEQELIGALKSRGLNVLPVFSHGVPDREAGALGPLDTARKFFIDEKGVPMISALVNLHFFFLGREQKGDISETRVAARTVEFFKALNVPVFKPVVSYGKSVTEWEEDPQGLTAEVSFGIAMPEFEGNIEPMIMACSQKLTDEATDTVFEIRETITERISRIAERISR